MGGPKASIPKHRIRADHSEEEHEGIYGGCFHPPGAKLLSNVLQLFDIELSGLAQAKACEGLTSVIEEVSKEAAETAADVKELVDGAAPAVVSVIQPPSQSNRKLLRFHSGI